jgi:predicted Zn-dependent peptidase
VDILSDIYLNSVFDRQEMDREKQVILQEIGMVEDSPEELLHLLFCSNCWPDHPLGRSVLGTGDTVSSISRETLVEYFSRNYTPDRIIISAAGNIDHKSLVGTLEPLFGPLEDGRAHSSTTKPSIQPGILFHEKNLEQVHICIGGKAPNLTSKDRLAGALLNTLLGGNMSSRLFQEVREKQGLAYSVYSFLSAYMDTGILGVYLGTDPHRVNKALEVVHNEIGRILKGDVEKNELEMMREHLVGSILLSSESNDTRMMRLAKNEYVFGRYVSYEELIENLNKVRIEDVIRIARDCFHEDEVSGVILGPIRPDEVQREHLTYN